jgi:hypothetical protein
MVWLSFINVSSRTLLLSWHQSQSWWGKQNPLFGPQGVKNLRSNQAKIHGSTNFDTPKLIVGVSCAHRCIIIGNMCNVGIKPN